jgi:cytochrome P450
VVGGLETTRNAIDGGLYALTQHPEQEVLLRTNRALMSTAIGEILRWTSPITHVARVATQDTEVAGRKIGKGETVALWLGSANQ